MVLRNATTMTSHGGHRSATQPIEPDRGGSGLKKILNTLTIHSGDRITAAN
jgi:hypothetical protein